MKFHLPSINQFAALLFLTITNAVFQLMVLPILIHHTDTAKLGVYFLALSYSSLLGILVNFGTMQTSMVALKLAQNQEEEVKVIAQTISLRFFPLLFALLITLVLPFVIDNGIYFILILPMVVAEFINPQFYLIATYKISKYAVINLILRVAFVALLFFWKNDTYLIQGALLGTGIIMLVLNLFYLKKVFIQTRVIQNLPSSKQLQQLYKTNSLVLGNGLTVHLQQSMYLFALPAFVSPLFLSAYGFIDKLVSSFRLLVNAYSSAVMPHATGKHAQGIMAWKKLKKQQNILLTISCLIAAAVLYFFPDQLLLVLLMGKKNNDLAFFTQVVQLMKMISWVPLLIALNVLNVLEIFLEKKYTAYFGSGLFLLFVSLISIDALKLGLPQNYAGYYPLLIESASFLISLFIVQKIRSAKTSE